MFKVNPATAPNSVWCCRQMRNRLMQEQRLRILVIDDDEGIQDALRMLFEQSGYDVDVFGDGEAVLRGDYRLPDLFVLDKQLPGVDGLDICRHLKRESRSRDIPVIMISASTNFERQAVAAGADAQLGKPFRMKELLGRTRELIEARNDTSPAPEPCL